MFRLTGNTVAIASFVGVWVAGKEAGREEIDKEKCSGKEIINMLNQPYGYLRSDRRRRGVDENINVEGTLMGFERGE